MTEHPLLLKLQRQLDCAVETFAGVAGACVQDIATGDRVEANADEPFPIASTVKIPILLTLLHRGSKGELDLQERVAITEDVLTPGSGVLTYLEGPLDLSVLDIAQLMMMVSDNTATNLCIDWAGMDHINALMRELGLEVTTIRRKMQDQESVARDLENVSTPGEAVSLMTAIHAGRPDRQVADKCLEILCKPNRGPIERAIQTGVKIANKPGGMDKVRCDAGLVLQDRHPYGVAVMTKYGREHPYTHENRVVEMVTMIHDVMETIEESSGYGQGIPADMRKRF